MQPQRIETFRRGINTGQAECIETRFETDDSAIRGRPQHRSAGLGAEGDRHHVIRDRRRRSAGRSAGRPGGIERVCGLSRGQTSEFTGYRIAENNRAGGPHLRHTGRICRRTVPVVDRRPHAGWHIMRVDDVLYAKRHTRQRAFFRLCIDRPRLRKRQFRIEEFPGADDIVAAGNPLKAGDGYRLGGECAGVYPGGYFGSGKRIEIV